MSIQYVSPTLLMIIYEVPKIFSFFKTALFPSYLPKVSLWAPKIENRSVTSLSSFKQHYVKSSRGAAAVFSVCSYWTYVRRACTWKYSEVTASVTLCSWCEGDLSRVLITTKEPDWVPATSQSCVSFGIWTVRRHSTGLVSITCWRETEKRTCEVFLLVRLSDAICDT